ncbi:MAG TPA: response regulator [Myxococcota bacterium]|nr:response regulator [Myxococcota bacterium]
MKVLYVEDDPASQKLVQKGLAAEDIEVTVVGDGSRAIEILKSTPFDALLLDIMLPGIDGFQVGRAARREALNKDIPIILLTAHPYSLREYDAKRLEPVAALTKPINFDKLIAALKSIDA